LFCVNEFNIEEYVKEHWATITVDAEAIF